MTEVKDIDREAATSVAVLVEMRELIRDGRAYYHATPFAVHREAAEKAERDRIVAWLLSYPPVIGLVEMAAWNTAANIERGGHLK